VIAGPGSITVNAGVTTNLTVTPSGNAAPTSYQWKRGGTNIVNSTHFAGATTASLFITNFTAADIGLYSNLVVNANGSVIAVGSLNVRISPTFSSIASSGGNMNMTFTSPSSLDTSSSFTLQSAGEVTGPYTNNPATITGTNPFSVSVPQTG